MSKEPNIYSYLDYRQYLKDYFAYKKEQSSLFSFRSFSRLANFKSSNFLKLIMEGQRNLSSQSLQQVGRALKLSKTQMNFFESLVLFNQAKTIDEKNFHYEKIRKFQKYQEAKPLEASQYSFFSHWYYVALRELITLKEFKEDPKWINQKIKFSLDPFEIKKALQMLIDLKLIKRNEEGRLVVSDEKVTTSSEIGSLIVVNYHKSMIQKAIESIEKTASEFRDLSALTISVSKKEFESICEKITQFRREIHEIASQNSSKEAVYQMNIQFFNLTELVWK